MTENLKILILTCSDSESRAKEFEISTNTKKKYAELNEGVDFVFEKRKSEDGSRPNWQKLKLLIDHINDGYDLLMWMDDDAGFVRYDDFRPFLPAVREDQLFMFTKERDDKQRTAKTFLNTGVFFVKPSDESKRILNEIYSRRHDNEFNDCYADQGAIISWVLRNTEKVSFLNQNLFNAFPNSIYYRNIKGILNIENDNTFILHFAGSHGGKTEMKKRLEEGLNRRTVPIIVSMTSYPRRFGVCSEVIRRILSATVKPEKIFLAIYKDEMNQLTDELRRMWSDGLIEIFPAPIDVRPHNKYVWSMLKYKDKPIITLDDDVAYEPDIVERLYDGYLSHQDSVCAIRFHQMTFDQNGRINNYMKWKFEVDELNTNFVVATGVSGVLYPPNFLSGIPTEQLEVAITKHITTDDIVLTWIRLKKGIKAFLVPSNTKQPPSLDSNNGLCFHENRGGVKNDMCVRDIIQPLLTK